MKRLNNEELANTKGGAKLLWYILGGFAILAVGFLDGLRNPLKCNN